MRVSGSYSEVESVRTVYTYQWQVYNPKTGEWVDLKGFNQPTAQPRKYRKEMGRLPLPLCRDRCRGHTDHQPGGHADHSRRCGYRRSQQSAAVSGRSRRGTDRTVVDEAEKEHGIEKGRAMAHTPATHKRRATDMALQYLWISFEFTARRPACSRAAWRSA